ncbi:Hypothetical predicted protein [Mytilus galloprovincialis]|uniref:Uncharacterized protein n=1 Tax=Mytilus galloprovincialis TaxID=29158 RepID=A0A8B6CC98_MYTGA|nr:Hypothetical predicted protein [Mytilus galloprovincialis]
MAGCPVYTVEGNRSCVGIDHCLKRVKVGGDRSVRGRLVQKAIMEIKRRGSFCIRNGVGVVKNRIVVSRRVGYKIGDCRKAVSHLDDLGSRKGKDDCSCYCYGIRFCLHISADSTYFTEQFSMEVSIPRSTLMSPHRVKPQRRSQYEPSDSMALSKHCVMGYESSIPSMVPAASNVGLKDATTGVKSKLQTTLADAERMATSYPFPYTSHMSSVRKPTKENTDLYKSYMDMTLPSSMKSNIPGVGEESVLLKKATEDLLNSTYSMMYELDKIKQERDFKDSRSLGRV